MWRKFFSTALVLVLISRAGAAAPVTFTFEVPKTGRDPWAREIWAEVVTPAHGTVRLPAYYLGDGKFAVRARADEPGEYRLGQVSEGAALTVKPVTPASVAVQTPERLPAVRIAGPAPGMFVKSTGEPYVPIGSNLAWSQGDPVPWYQNALKHFGAAGLNWSRIWMCHWGGLNLDWRAEDGRTSPPIGQIDPEVAGRWDRIVAAAEDDGVYFQMVLQHHGQWVSRGANTNWAQNPWNAANPGGFLQKASDFFTSSRALELTRRKYRYIVARWGYSPAILAWELFNEVHWTDALAIDGNVAAVAKWHTAMAEYIRSLDTYHHLVTTSTEELGSPIYAALDYYQPHLYSTNMLAAVRRFDLDPAKLDKPVFYGEMGDDHMVLTPEQADSVVELPPIVWASLTGEGRYPAQVWDGWRLLARNRVEELGAVARFLRETKLAEREGLQPFSAVVKDAPMVPYVIEPGEAWKKRGAVELTVPMDGRQTPELALMPQVIVGAAHSMAEGFVGRVTLRVDSPRPAIARLLIADGGAGSAAARVQVDGVTAGEDRWPALPKGGKNPARRPKEIVFSVSAGPHTLVVDNPGGEDIIELKGLDLGLQTPVLATQGRRGERFIMLWVWNRQGVYALKDPAPARGTVVLDDVPAGAWTVTWWDTSKGVPAETRRVEHKGGALELATPPVARQAAVVLTRAD